MRRKFYTKTQYIFNISANLFLLLLKFQFLKFYKHLFLHYQTVLHLLTKKIYLKKCPERKCVD